MLPRPSRALSIVCFGEVLWDILPRGIFLGGAPLNVAYHLSRQGVRAVPVSAVGRGFLGLEAIRRIGSWGLETDYIARRPDRPTGTVQATLNAHGAATYRIAKDVAWDRIAVPRMLLHQPAPAALVFGTLALREEPNRHALARLSAAWPGAVRVLDLNLRAPFDRGAAVNAALAQAQMVKLNDEELTRMTNAGGRTTARLQRAARQFASERRLARVCVTAGSQGAGLLWDGDWHWEPARPTVVRDTVGAGDAFLAGLLAALWSRGATPREALARACRLGEFVAARDGATPPYRGDRHGRPRDSAG